MWLWEHLLGWLVIRRSSAAQASPCLRRRCMRSCVPSASPSSRLAWEERQLSTNLLAHTLHTQHTFGYFASQSTGFLFLSQALAEHGTVFAFVAPLLDTTEHHECPATCTRGLTICVVSFLDVSLRVWYCFLFQSRHTCCLMGLAQDGSDWKRAGRCFTVPLLSASLDFVLEFGSKHYVFHVSHFGTLDDLVSPSRSLSVLPCRTSCLFLRVLCVGYFGDILCPCSPCVLPSLCMNLWTA